MRWLPGSLLVFLVALIAMWGFIGPRPATTYTVNDVLAAALLYAGVYALGHSHGGSGQR